MAESKKSDSAKYTKPELRDRIKKKVLAGDKGGSPGRWSARKAQLVAHEYEAEGGGFKKSPDESQQSLMQWGEEERKSAEKSATKKNASPAKKVKKKNGAMSLRIGFPVKVLGAEGLKSNDARRWQSNPHLRVSLEYLSKILDYLEENRMSMYRMASDLAPYATHPDFTQFHNQVKECRKELKQIGRRVQAMGARLSFHPSQFIVLNSPDEALREKSIWDLRSQGEILDRMELGPEAVLVIHVGGSYGDNVGSLERWCQTWEKLPQGVRNRLVLEHDDLRFSAAEVLTVHERTGVRLVFDVQHFSCLNPEGLAMGPTIEKFLRTWPAGVRPKLHFSSPRTEMREVSRKDRKTGKKRVVLQAPVWTAHAAFVHPFEFISFMRSVPDLEFDVMIEAKAKDLALIRLRHDLVRYAPDVAGRFGLGEKDATEDVPDEIVVDAEELSA